MLTVRQRQMLMFIAATIRQTGTSPSIEEMREDLGLASKSGVARMLDALEERGFIRRLRNRARAIEVIRLPEADACEAMVQFSDAQLLAECATRAAWRRAWVSAAPP